MWQLKIFLFLCAQACALVSVECALVLSVTNATIPVEETKANLGPKYRPRKTSITVSCKLSDSNNAKLTDPSISWYRLDRINGTSPTIVRTLDSNLLSIEEKVTIKNPQHGSSAAYVCAGKSGSEAVNGTVVIESMPLIIVGLNGSGTHGNSFWSMAEHPDLVIQPDQLAIVKCLVDAIPISDMTKWVRVDSSGAEIPVGNGSVIELTRASYQEDRGHYVCRASNSLGNNSFRIFLRVKNRDAFRLPLIIMCILFGITIAISVVYELCKRKQRAAYRAQDILERGTIVAT